MPTRKSCISRTGRGFETERAAGAGRGVPSVGVWHAPLCGGSSPCPPVGDLRRAQGSTLRTTEAEIDSLPYANRLANRLVDKIQGTA